MIVTVLAAIVILVPLWFLFLKPAKTPVSQSGPSITFSLYDHAVYEGTDTVVKEIKMAPNTDSVDFGVVENKQSGKTLLIYVKDNNPAEDEVVNPSDDVTTVGPEQTGLDTRMIIIIAAAAVAVTAAAVVVVIVSKKKKTAK